MYLICSEPMVLVKSSNMKLEQEAKCSHFELSYPIYGHELVTDIKALVVLVFKGFKGNHYCCSVMLVAYPDLYKEGVSRS